LAQLAVPGTVRQDQRCVHLMKAAPRCGQRKIEPFSDGLMPRQHNLFSGPQEVGNSIAEDIGRLSKAI
jgi:hypothetical protein